MCIPVFADCVFRLLFLCPCDFIDSYSSRSVQPCDSGVLEFAFLMLFAVGWLFPILFWYFNQKGFLGCHILLQISTWCEPLMLSDKVPKNISVRSSFVTETATKTGMIMVLGEINSKAEVNYQKVVRETIRDIGYDDSCKGNSISPTVRYLNCLRHVFACLDFVNVWVWHVYFIKDIFQTYI